MGFKTLVCWLTLHLIARAYLGRGWLDRKANGSFIGLLLSFWVFFPILIYVNLISAFGLEA